MNFADRYDKCVVNLLSGLIHFVLLNKHAGDVKLGVVVFARKPRDGLIAFFADSA